MKLRVKKPSREDEVFTKCPHNAPGRADGGCVRCIRMEDVLRNPTEAKANDIIEIVEWGTTHADLIDAMHHMPTEKWLAYQQLMCKKLGHSRSLVATTPYILYIKQVTLQQQKQQSVELARILLDRDATELHRTLKTQAVEFIHTYISR